MIIIGAKGFAKEVLEILFQINIKEDICFFDDLNTDVPNFLFNKFEVYTCVEDVKKHFQEKENHFTLGIGNPILRKNLSEKFEMAGGLLKSTISPFAKIGHFGNEIGMGCNIMTGSIITNDVIINNGCLINLNCTIGHDSKIGLFVELSPGVHISGNCIIGNYTRIGTNATVLPHITIGNNVTVAAGSVVTKNVPDNCMVAGVPAIIKKELNPIFNA